MSTPRPPRPPNYGVALVIALLMAVTLAGALALALLEGRY